MSELNEQLRAANAECKHRREDLAESTPGWLKLINARKTAPSACVISTSIRASPTLSARSRREDLERPNTELARCQRQADRLEDVHVQFTLLVTPRLTPRSRPSGVILRLILEGYMPQPKVRETLEKAEKRAMEQLALIADLSKWDASDRRAAGRCSRCRWKSCCTIRPTCWPQAHGSGTSPSNWKSVRTCRPWSPTPIKSRAFGTIWSATPSSITARVGG